MKSHYFVGVGAEVMNDGAELGRDEYYLIEAYDREEAMNLLYDYLDKRYYEFEYDVLEEIDHDITGIITH